MTRDEAQKLLGAYATGSLTADERRLLLEAALDDQDLFNHLAREHELKQILDEPGAKARLIDALAPPRPRFSPIWLWTASAAAVASLAVAAWLFVRGPKPAPAIQVAQVDAVTPAPPPAAAPVAPTPAPPKRTARNKTPAPAPAPALQAQDQVEPKAQAPTGVVGGIAGAARRESRALATPNFRAPRLGFDYTIEPEFLTLRFASAGWFSLHYSPGDDTIEQSHVAAGQTRRIAIPNNATEAAIIFSVDAQTDPALGVNLTRTGKSGSVEDPSGNRIEVLLKFY